MKTISFSKLFLAFLSALMLLSCSQKKNDGSENPQAEEKKELTQEEFLKEKLDEYLEENPNFLGYYVRDKGYIIGITFEGDRLYYIEYKLDGEEYVESERSEVTMGTSQNKWCPGITNRNGYWNRLDMERYPSYDTLEDAVMRNFVRDYGNQVRIKSVTATSTLGEKYSAENLVDGSWNSWAEGEDGSGIGTKITFEFVRPYMFEDYTNYACINIVNGYGDLKYFYQNNRVKDMNLWIDDDKTPVKVNLFDTHLGQSIVLRKYIGNRFVRKITLEILSVYPGTKYDDTCISEVYIGPFDDDYIMPLDPSMAEMTLAYYRDVKKDSDHYRMKNGVLEWFYDVGHDPRMDWVKLNLLPGSYTKLNFDFAGDTPIIVVPGEVQNPDDVNEGGFEEECLPLYKELKFYAYKNGSWKEEKNSAVNAEIEKVMSEHKDQYFTIRLNNYQRDYYYAGVNDGEDANYSLDNPWYKKYIRLTFYKEKRVLLDDSKDNEGQYYFKYDGKGYVIGY